MKSMYIHTTIRKPFSHVYGFLAKPENFTLWASGLATGEFRKMENGLWFAQTPMGEMHIRFTPVNEFGILDHWVIPPEGEEMYNPMRVIHNAEGCDVVFTLFQRDDMTESDMQRDHAWVMKDLAQLKMVLERD